MTIAELDLTLTTGSQNISATTAQFVPQGVRYFQIINPSATASIAYSLGVPTVNGVGVTVAPLGSSTVSCVPGDIFPLKSLNLIGSAGTTATVFWS